MFILGLRFRELVIEATFDVLEPVLDILSHS